MATGGNAYSNFVAWAKIVLPLSALALLATLFLIARRINPDDALNYTEVDVEQIAREARIGAPEFSGVTADGTVISVAADVARPDPARPGRMTADGLSARFEIPGGSQVDAAAGAGSVDSPDQQMELTGGVEINTSTGYRIASDGLTAALGLTNLRSSGPITADGPPGRIEAGAMVLSQNPDDPNSYLLVFNGGVKLVYTPPD